LDDAWKRGVCDRGGQDGTGTADPRADGVAARHEFDLAADAPNWRIYHAVRGGPDGSALVEGWRPWRGRKRAPHSAR
jgi:hypothetical protein